MMYSLTHKHPQKPGIPTHTQLNMHIDIHAHILIHYTLEARVTLALVREFQGGVHHRRHLSIITKVCCFLLAYLMVGLLDR